MDLFEIAGTFGIITSILSFCNNAALASICKYAMYGFWGICFVLILFKGRCKIRPIIWYMLAVYGIMFVLGRLFYSLGEYQSYGPGPAMYLPYCAFFYFVGYNCQNDCEREAGIYIKAYLFAHVVFVIIKYIFIRDVSTISLDKNQAGQIVGVGIILSLFLLPLFEERKWVRWGFFAFALFAFMVLIQLHTRTPALAVLIVIAFWLFSLRKKKRYIVLAVLIVVISAIYFYTENGSGFLFEYLRGDKSQEEMTWSAVTSGRTDLYAETFREFLQHPLIGQGAWAYLDSFPLHLLRTGGLLAAFLVLPLAYGRMFHDIRLDYKQLRFQEEKAKPDGIVRLAGVLSVFYFTVSLFEGYPPLGPNASTFFLWLIIGLADRHGFEMEEHAISWKKAA